MKDRYKFRGLRGDSHSFAYGSLQVNEEGHCTIDGNPVHPETVGQCTGLKDKNEKLIFEGDIVRYFDDGETNDLISLVGFGEYEYGDNIGWGYFLKIGEDTHPFPVASDLEVAGNIHENKELLEGGKYGS